MAFFTYIMASQRNGTLYTGSTDDLVCRSLQHKTKRFSGFTSKYGVDRLVWYEVFESRSGAFKRERQIKKMESALEAGPDRENQSRLGGSD